MLRDRLATVQGRIDHHEAFRLGERGWTCAQGALRELYGEQLYLAGLIDEIETAEGICRFTICGHLITEVAA